MSWRISVSSLDKKEQLMVLDEDSDKVLNPNCKRIFSDFCTDLWCELKDDNEFNKHIVCFNDSDDMDFYTIDKDGWLIFIEAIKDKYINFLKSIKDKDEIKDENDALQFIKTGYSGYKSYIKHLINYWETSWDTDNKLKTKYGMTFDYRDNVANISGGMTWDGCFYDALYLHKTFDWEHYNLIIIGG